MNEAQIARWRLRTQRLVGRPFASPLRVLQAFAAMQAQEFLCAKWSIAMRTARADNATIDRLLAQGEILRTHVLRPTWHFVLPADLRWLLRLTGPRVDAANAFMYRKLHLDATVFKRSHSVVARALAGGRHLTRTELASHLSRVRLPSVGFALAYVLMRAEIDGIVCSGAMRGKQHTYALLEERVAPGRVFDGDEALAELARRFFTTRGPATAKDFATWSSLTVAQARKALDLLRGEFEQFEHNGRVYFFAGSVPSRAARGDGPHIALVQGYDEVIMAYRESKDVLRVAANVTAATGPASVPMHAVLVDGRLAGHWKPEIGAAGVSIETWLRRRFDETHNAVLRSATERFARFLRLPLAPGR